MMHYGKEDSNQVRSKREWEEMNTMKRIQNKVKDKETLSLDEEIEEVTKMGRYDGDRERPVESPLGHKCQQKKT